MQLSEDLLIAFAKSMKTEEKQRDVTLFGIVKSIEADGSVIVTLDGSEADTKAKCAVSAEVDDRVMVLMKDHSAIITGNLSNGSGGAATSYLALTNKPSIEGVTLIGNKTFDDLTLTSITNTEIEELVDLSERSS